MDNIESLQKEIENLPKEALSRFRRWFLEYDADNWDMQLEKDIREGKLDKIAEEGVTEYQNGKCSKL